jgi:hypothetical protein
MSDAGRSKSWLLKSLFDGKWPEDLSPLSLNVALSLPPWWPSLVVVWMTGDDAPPEWEQRGERLQYWREAQALLTDLHDDYRAHRGPPA